MVSVPAIVYIGDVQIEGGQASTFGSKPDTDGASAQYEQGLVGLGLSKDEFGRGIPWDPFNQNAGSVSTLPPFDPYWDGSVEKWDGVGTGFSSTVLTVAPLYTEVGAITGGASTIDDAGQAWTLGELFGAQIEITGGTGVGQKRYISSNTATLVTVSVAWTTQPDGTSEYDINWLDDELIGRKVRVRKSYTDTLGALASSTTTQVDVDGSPAFVDDVHNSRTIRFTSGALNGVERTITDTLNGNELVLSSALAQEPDGMSFIIFGAGYDDEAYVAITDNDTNTLTVAAWGNGTPDSTSELEVKGDFVVFHHLDMTSDDINPLFVIERNRQKALGDNWFRSGGGITPMTGLINAWNNNHPSTPYFKAIKFGIWNGDTASWNNSTSWAAFTTEFAFCEAHEAALSNTLDVQQVVFDCTFTDIKNGTAAATFETALSGAIDTIRAKFPNAHIQVVNHHAEIYNTGQPGKAPELRGKVVEVVASKTNCSVFDMGQFAEFRPEVSFAPHWLGATAPATEPQSNYRTEDYANAGLRLYNSWQAAIATLPAGTPGSAFPVYVLIGDSQMTGTNAISYITGIDTISLLGESPGYTVAGRYVYNGQTQVVELSDVSSNPNTNGDVNSTTFGPEQTFMRRLHQEHPNGFVCLKYGRAAHSLSVAAIASGSAGALKKSAATLWLEIEAMWTGFLQACARDLIRVPSVKGVGIVLGDNDKLSVAAAEEFSSEAAQFVSDLRDLFQTDEDETLSVTWLEPPKHITNGGLSQHGVAEAQTTISAALTALGAADDKVEILAEDQTKYEVERIDTTHYSTHSTYLIGEDMAASLIALNSVEGAPSTETVGAATLTVETGSGSPDANSLTTVAFADSFLQEIGNPAEWSSASDLEKESALRQMSQWITYAKNFEGRRLNDSQALAFPRYDLRDRDGWLVDSNSVHVDVQKAASFGAYRIVKGDWSPFPDVSGDGSVSAESINIGGIAISTTFAGIRHSEAPRLMLVERMLSQFYRKARTMRLVRG